MIKRNKKITNIKKADIKSKKKKVYRKWND